MNSIAHAGYNAASTSLPNIREVSRQRIGRIRLPPANTEYRIAACIELGGTLSAGISRSRCASTASRSSSKNSGSFIVQRVFLSAELAGFTYCSLLRAQTLRRPACHRLSSTISPLVLPLLPVASGIPAKGSRPLQTISWPRPGKAAGSPVSVPLPPAAITTSQNPAFSLPLVFSEQVNPRRFLSLRLFLAV